MRAVRATVVVCGLFALTHNVIGNAQIATFAAFGGFATLVLASFAGTRRDKLAAHAALAIAGSVLLTIGTVVSSSTALAAIATVPVAFAVFFAGVAGPNAANGVAAALLAYVLPAASRGTIGMVPDRLTGWWLASLAGTAAVLAFSPRPGDDELRAATSRLAVVLSNHLEAVLAGAAAETDLGDVLETKRELLARFTATPYRPTGLAAADQALANAIELLEWCAALIVDAVRERDDPNQASPEDRALIVCASSVLREAASLLAGGDARPDVDRLERLRAAAAARLDHARLDPLTSRDAARIAFHAHTIAVAVLAFAFETLIAARVVDPEWLEVRRRRWYGGATAARTAHRIRSVASTALTHTSLRSVWFVNSLRGSVALAAAVAVADLGSVQHGFWVVLGTLSVLRTNAASTGATAARALLGTAIGFVIGGALLVAIGKGSTALWVVLPLAVFFAAYTPGTAPFAVGQAAFTVTVAVLFNLLVPVGWHVGVVRIEDVALGCAVSVVVGTLFWPRGVSGVVGNDLADAFRLGAAYLCEAVGWATGRRAQRPIGAVVAGTAGLRLDDAVRAFLAEQGSKRIPKQDLWRLIGGSLRLRLTAHAVADLPRGAVVLDAGDNGTEPGAAALAAWYERLAELVGRPIQRDRAPRTLEVPEPVEAWGPSSGSYYGIWLSEHLAHLSEHLGELVDPALHVAEIRRRPWWR